jgi:hypothetical protein
MEGTMLRSAPLFLIVAMILTACDRVVEIDESTQATLAEIDEALDSRAPFPPGALFERVWIGDAQWELVKPRPPGVGAPEHVRTRVYQIGRVADDDPLSPPIEVPGVISLGGRDHVYSAPSGNGGTHSGLAQTVPIVLPGWYPMPPFEDVQCAPPDLGEYAGRILWRMLDVSVHPCGVVPQVYAVDFQGDGCHEPLTSVEKIYAAVEGGFARFEIPPEEPWPFAIRPATGRGQSKGPVVAPTCIGD